MVTVLACVGVCAACACAGIVGALVLLAWADEIEHCERILRDDLGGPNAFCDWE